MTTKRIKYGGRKKGSKNRDKYEKVLQEEDKGKLLKANEDLKMRRTKGVSNSLASIFADPYKFISLLKIKNKKGKGAIKIPLS